MSQVDSTIDTTNKRKLELLNELAEILSSREPIDYNSFISPKEGISTEELTRLNEEKDKEVKALQRAWEDLEGLLFNDLQITLQEKNQLVAFLGNKRKEEKQKKKNRGRTTQVWRAD